MDEQRVRETVDDEAKSFDALKALEKQINRLMLLSTRVSESHAIQVHEQITRCLELHAKLTGHLRK
ncbi:hypothetical protein GCM10025857_15390 [Alicyclobacillus contaminans]|uniref:hypothetical protein n=1 Tax=Alicyclobacillus contaminans TaxID=392016 RepID=UPI0003F9164B|nr:hypothetical protein [Alicyclobacillus contaminans]GMA50182.1 hypothetical protein GCM10025857_15390 [Alicyclobacillus contaminans]